MESGIAGALTRRRQTACRMNVKQLRKDSAEAIGGMNVGLARLPHHYGSDRDDRVRVDRARDVAAFA